MTFPSHLYSFHIQFLTKTDLFRSKTSSWCSSHYASRKLGAIFGYLGFWAGKRSKMEKNIFFPPKSITSMVRHPKKWQPPRSKDMTKKSPSTSHLYSLVTIPTQIKTALDKRMLPVLLLLLTLQLSLSIQIFNRKFNK